jgi:prepilin-type processing-associated H-X9-DG protein
MNRFFLNRHDGAINAIFLDFNVEKIPLKEMFELNWHKGYNRANAWTVAGGVTEDDWEAWGDGWIGEL